MDPTEMMIKFLEDSMNEHVRKAWEAFQLIQQLRTQQATAQPTSLLKQDQGWR